MDSVHGFIGIVAGVLALIGYVPYIVSTLKGKTRPNKATWIIWTIVGGLLAFSYLAEGDEKAIWVPLSYFIGPLIVAILSFKYGFSQWSRLDKVCVVVAVLSLVPWALADDAMITLLINLGIDMSGAIPTLVKSYREPDTEDFTAWFIFFAANTLLLFSITQWNLAVLYPVYLFFLAGGMVVLIIRGKMNARAISFSKESNE